MRAELNRALVIGRDVSDTHEFVLACFDSILEVLLGEDSWILGLPIDAIDEPRDQVKVLLEVSLILFWVLVVVRLLEVLCLVAGARDIARRKDRDYDLPVVVCILWVGQVLTELRRWDLDVRQLLKYFNATLSNAASSCDSEDHGSKGTWHTTFADVGSEARQGILHVVVVEVHVRAADQEGRLILLLQQKFANASKEIKGSRDSSVASESNETLLEVLAFYRCLTDALEIDHANLELL